MIIGIGVDIVDVERFKWMLRRTPATLSAPSLLPRHMTEVAERVPLNRWRHGFAAKEAVVKALGDVGELRPLECEVQTADLGRPVLRLLGKLKELSDELRITDWHVSLAHDGGQAIAYVIAERRE